VGFIGRAPLGAADARLLRALREQYPEGHFDEINISIDALRRPELLAALSFIGPKIDRRRRALSHRSREAVEQWIENVAERDIGAGLYLRRDRRGWCYIERVGRVPTGGSAPSSICSKTVTSHE
jgi:hypothetical protein